MRERRRSRSLRVVRAPWQPDKRVCLRGNTMEVRERLSKMGAHWNEPLQAWVVPLGHLPAAKEAILERPSKIPLDCWCPTCERPL